jgi:hypothetical protein
MEAVFNMIGELVNYEWTNFTLNIPVDQQETIERQLENKFQSLIGKYILYASILRIYNVEV